MTTIGGVFHLGEDLQGEASLEAGTGQFLELGEEKGLCLCERNHRTSGPSLCLLADLGPMRGTRRPVCKRSGAQEVTSFDRKHVQEIQVLCETSQAWCILKMF